MVRTGRAAYAIAALLAAVVIPAAAASPAHVARTYTIVLDKMAFGTPPPDLHVGDTIMWANHDLFRHSATARDRRFDLDLPSGKTARLVLKEPGTIGFFCKFHPGMTGRLKVARRNARPRPLIAGGAFVWIVPLTGGRPNPPQNHEARAGTD
jgi:plastocyanin